MNLENEPGIATGVYLAAYLGRTLRYDRQLNL